MSNDTTPSKRPDFTAYSVREYPRGAERKTDWTRIGVAWAHRDGDGFDVVLEALPVSGRVALRRNKPRASRA